MEVNSMLQELKDKFITETRAVQAQAIAQAREKVQDLIAKKNVDFDAEKQKKLDTELTAYNARVTAIEQEFANKKASFERVAMAEVEAQVEKENGFEAFIKSLSL